MLALTILSYYMTSCRICLDDEGILVKVCACSGSMANVHEECIREWIKVRKSHSPFICELCHEPYDSRIIESIPQKSHPIAEMNVFMFVLFCLRLFMTMTYIEYTLKTVFGAFLALWIIHQIVW